MTMLFLWNFQGFFLYFIIWQVKISNVITSWPSSNSSNIQILGLFENESETVTCSVHCRAMFKAAVLLSQQYNITIEGRFIQWQSAETGGNVINALSESCQAVSESNIVGIIGPELSREAHLTADFGKTIGIPVISYAATDPDLSDKNAYPAFYRTVPSDNAAALAIVKFFIRFNWKSCIIIYQNDAYGFDGAKVINEAFINNNFTVREMIVFDIVTRRIRGNLKNDLTNSETRIVVLWAEPIYTSIIIQNALDADVLGPQFTWILSSYISLKSFNKTFHQKLIGMFAIEPVVGSVVNARTNTKLLNAAYKIWKKYEPETFPESTKVDSYALFAFDATWLLIQSLKNFCSKVSTNSSSSCFSFIRSSYCFKSRFIHSNLLFNTISKTKFIGVSGRIRFNNNVTDRINGSYYYAQNVQLSSNSLKFVPILVYSHPFNWKTYLTSIIVWPGNSLISPNDRAKLKGVTLRIGVIESPPFTMVQNIINPSEKNRTKFIGYIPDVIELLEKKMGFTSNIQLAPLNQSYSGLVQSMADGVYDMVIGDVTITSKRRELVGFSNGIFDNSLRIMMRKTPDNDFDLLSHLKPFSISLWLILLLTSVCAGILLYLIERQNNEALQNRSIISSTAMSLWFSVGTIMGYGVDFHVRTAAGRLLTLGLYMLSLILVASYTANLASNLTISKSKNIISGIDDIKNGKIPFNRIGIRVNTASEDYYLREISGGSRNYYLLKTQKDLYDSLLNGIIDVTIIDIAVAAYITNNIYCNLTLVGGDFDKSAFGIVIPKQWLYAQDLDVNILSLKESGDLDRLKIKWFQKKFCSNSIETSTAMGIRTMGGLLLTFAVITIFSLLLFIWKKNYILKYFGFILEYLKKLFVKKRQSYSVPSSITLHF